MTLAEIQALPAVSVPRLLLPSDQDSYYLLPANLPGTAAYRIDKLTTITRTSAQGNPVAAVPPVRQYVSLTYTEFNEVAESGNAIISVFVTSPVTPDFTVDVTLEAGWTNLQVGAAIRAALLAPEQSALQAVVDVGGTGGEVRLTIVDPDAEYLPYFNFTVDTDPDGDLLWYPATFGGTGGPEPGVEGVDGDYVGQLCRVGDEAPYAWFMWTGVSWMPVYEPAEEIGTLEDTDKWPVTRGSGLLWLPGSKLMAWIKAKIETVGAVVLPVGNGGTGAVDPANARINLGVLPPHQLFKTDRLTPAFEYDYTGSGTTDSHRIRTSQAITVRLSNGSVKSFNAGTEATANSVTLTPGTDYAIYATSSGLYYSDSFVLPDSLIGGFHFMAGSCAPIAANTDPATTGGSYGDGPYLVRSGNFQISTGNFYFRAPGGSVTYKASATLSLSTTIPTAKWGVWSFGIDAAGTITVYTGSANAVGYDSESLALADIPTVPAGSRRIGYVTVQAHAANPFIPGTDALAGGTGGNVAQATKYYSESSQGPSVNPYSLWDLNFRPKGADPRGMALIGGTQWLDIYLLNTRPDLYGTSSYNKTIADDGNRVLRPAAIGGDGSLVMPDHNWWSASLVAGVHGKHFPSVELYHRATLGAKVGAITVFDPVVTAGFAFLTSRYGIQLSFGAMLVMLADTGSAVGKHPIAGGAWPYLGATGPRALWDESAVTSTAMIGTRLAAEHMVVG